MKKLFLIPILTLLLLSVLINPAAGQNKGQVSNSSSAVEMMFQHPKIHAPNSVLKNFVNGEPKTRVIINLRKPSNSKQFKNLKKIQVRKHLKQTVKEAQKRVITVLNTKKIRITNKFSYVFGFSAEVSLEGLIDLLDHPDILSIEEDAINHAQLNQGISLINAFTVRNTYNGAGMSIAICDTGIDYTHPRLGNGRFPNTKVIGGWDCGDNDSDPMDIAGHGTACAGIAAGDLGTTGDYIGGVAYGAKLYALKISSGTSGSAFTSDMIEAWEWSITHQNDDPANPIMIISTSFGGGRYFSTCDNESTGMTAAAANAVSAGITLFVSSGNNGYCDSMGWPACISDVNSVGAVYDATLGQNPPPGYVGCISNESCVGTLGPPCDEKYYVDSPANADMVTSYSNSSSFLDIFAPSEWTTTTKLGGGYWDTANGFGGTSAACPYAAGAAACLQSANKAKQGIFLTPDQVKTKLISYGDPITDGKAGITKPRINLGDSIDSIASSDWEVLEQLTDNPTDYLGKNMLVKFSLKVIASIDPAQPFYNSKELQIRIYDASDPGNILQTSEYGYPSTSYRITDETYITTFNIPEDPAEYVVEVWNLDDNIIIGSFEFATGAFDDDAIFETEDNCPDKCNTNQQDADNDGIGDVCDETPGCGGCGQSACEIEC